MRPTARLTWGVTIVGVALAIAVVAALFMYQGSRGLPVSSASPGTAERSSAASRSAEDREEPSRGPGTNAGTNEQLTDEVAGWTYHLAAGQDRIAAYQFNANGTVVATVGTEESLDYPAMFWQIDEHDRIVVSDERDLLVPAESWAVISIQDSVVTVKNAVNDREETYIRKRHWPPAARAVESPDAP